MITSKDTFSSNTVSIKAADNRFAHITNILKLEPADTIKIGVVDAGLYNDATIESISEESLTISLNEKQAEQYGDSPQISLVLACPRPRRLTSLLPVLSQLGVSKILVTGGDKVPKDYFGAKCFWDENTLTDLLVEGLSQNSQDYKLPKLGVHKRSIVDFDIRKIDEAFPRDKFVRMVAHPPEPSDLKTDGTKN